MHLQHLQLRSANIHAQKEFYEQQLGLECQLNNKDTLLVNIGNTQLELQQHPIFYPYHFAINIPYNQIESALHSLQTKLEILSFQGHLIQEFSAWNARAIYFYDADHNIVELIGRKNLNNASNEPFNVDSLLQISEIGWVVEDIETAYAALSKNTVLPIYDGSFDRFCALGDEQGLFICINKNKKKWFPKDDIAHIAPFQLQFEHQNQSFHLAFEGNHMHSIT